jgi:hypothetical protein
MNRPTHTHTHTFIKTNVVAAGVTEVSVVICCFVLLENKPRHTVRFPSDPAWPAVISLSVRVVNRDVF